MRATRALSRAQPLYFLKVTVSLISTSNPLIRSKAARIRIVRDLTATQRRSSTKMQCSAINRRNARCARSRRCCAAFNSRPAASFGEMHSLVCMVPSDFLANSFLINENSFMPSFWSRVRANSACHSRYWLRADCRLEESHGARACRGHRIPPQRVGQHSLASPARHMPTILASITSRGWFVRMDVLGFLRQCLP